MRTHAHGSPADVRDVAGRLEHRLLDAFWSGARTVENRLELLLEYTHVIVRRADTWESDAVRRQHLEHHGLARTIMLDRVRCFACGSGGQLYAHHIIEIQYGGSNAVRNQVPLCFDCHQYLHPWLTEDDRASGDVRRSFESIGDIIGRAGKGVGA